VTVGDEVAAGQSLLVVEAMKMEHVIAASAPGRVARVHVAVGDQVQRGQLLVDLEAAEAAASERGTGG
jgi:biotin carboxyl carrier protein